MKVRELVEKLLNEDQDAEVFVASDEEGNSINPLWSAVASQYLDTGSEIDLIHPADIEAGEYDEDDIADFGSGVVLWP